MLARALLLAAAVAVAALAPIALIHADPPCTANGCPHGPTNTPPPVNVNSPSYKDGYKSEHDFYGTERNRTYLSNQMKNGYDVTRVCAQEIKGGPMPPSPAEWLSGCVDALHDLGLKP